MKIIPCILSFLFVNTILYGQINPASQWTWINGDSATNVHGVYGTKGVAGVSNKPGARTTATSFKDAAGNIWIFGGSGILGPGSSHSGFLNDLWKYDPISNQWAWVSGDSTIATCSVYGTKGVPSVNNRPGGLSGAVEWTDASGNFWFFGGGDNCLSGIGPYSNELWKYNPSTNEWTFVNDHESDEYLAQPLGQYGTQGVSSASNWPGARTASASWKDIDGNFWMYGGQGYGLHFAPRAGALSDLWKYSPSTGQWVWVSGNKDENIWGHYGIKGVGAAVNNPGARTSTSAWMDQDNNCWLFGGFYDDIERRYFFNDVWKYNSGANQWTWVNGDSLTIWSHYNGNIITDSNSVYGEAGVLSPVSKPAGRGLCYSSMDNNGNLWFWGGETKNVYLLTELWRYNIATNQWAWIKDTLATQAGVYGTKGVSAPDNIPGGRQAGVSWMDASGNFYIYGGYGITPDGYGYLNEMWKLVPGSVLAFQMINVTANVVDEKIAVQWQTAQENSSDYFMVEHSRNAIDFTACGKLPAAGNSASRKTYSFTDDHPFNGINFYRIKTVNLNGTFSYSGIATASKVEAMMLPIFPNPAKDFIQVTITEKMKGSKLQIVSADGKIILEKVVAGNNNLMLINIKNLTSGTYHILVKNKTGNMLQEFVKQ